MKRILTTLVLAFAAVFAFAQDRDIPAGMRMEITSIEDDDDQFSLFTYKDEDGTFGYYLSLGHEFNLLEIFESDLFSSLSHMDEVCLYLGDSPEAVLNTLDGYLAMLDEETGTTFEIPCRLTNGAEKLTERSTATGIVVKRFLQRKRLCLNFTIGDRSAEADMTKSGIKSIRWNFELARKLNLTD